jgi:putative transposase
LDEALVKINGKLCYLWRAVDHEGEVVKSNGRVRSTLSNFKELRGSRRVRDVWFYPLEAVVTARRDKAAALKLLKRVMKKYPRPKIIVTDGLRAYSAAMNEIGVADRQEVGPRLNNRAENSHQPFRRRERGMQRFWSKRTLKKFSSVHAQVRNHFNQERHRQVYKQRRLAALDEWRTLAAEIAACERAGRATCRRASVTLTLPWGGVGTPNATLDKPAYCETGRPISGEHVV